MKIRSLLIGSVAAAGLSTGAFAADLGVLTSLDVCDALGLSGLTISSDTNCLQITGGVTYEFNWGDYRREAQYVAFPPNALNQWADASSKKFGVKGSTNNAAGDPEWADYDTKLEAWLRVVGTADSDFGPAKAVIGIHQVERYRMQDGGWANSEGYSATAAPGPYYGVQMNGDTTNGVELQEAYLSIGDSTVIMAGLRKDGKDGSVGNFDDDEPFNYLGLYGTQMTDAGVIFKNGAPVFGGMSIQVVSDLGNGLSVGVGLENIDNTDGTDPWVGAGGVGKVPVITAKNLDGNYAGTLLGVINYAGDSLTAHLTGGAIGVLDGHVDSWFAHAGATGTFDNFKLRAALGYLRDDTNSMDFTEWHGVLSGSATFDMFTLALSGEYMSASVGAVTDDAWGFGGSIGAKVTDTVSLNLGGRWFHYDPNAGADQDSWQVEAQLVAALTETIKATAAVGVYGGDVVEAQLTPGAVAGAPALSGDDTAYYGSLGLDWAPGGGFTASVKGLATSEGSYKATFKAAKSFQ